MATWETLTLRGLRWAPAQVWGGVRIVPLLRDHVPGDLRLGRREYGDDDAMVVSLEGELLGDGLKYISYVPAGLVVSWSEHGEPVAALGAELREREGKRLRTSGGATIRVAHRMARREDKHRLRLLPLHLAMEGFLALHFKGPDVAWPEYSARVLASGLSPRTETSYSAAAIHGLADALRVFEIHEGQVGALLFVADALASAFVVSHPDDYRALHRSLIEDFFGELMVYYSRLPSGGRLETSLDDQRVHSLEDLRRALEDMRGEWRQLHQDMARELIARPLHVERIYRAGPFQLQRFMTQLDPSSENHLGEAIVRDDGTVEYLKTFRLSAAQTRRAYLLSQLAVHGWNLAATARALRETVVGLARRLIGAGFGYVLSPQVHDQVRQADAADRAAEEAARKAGKAKR